MSHLQPVVLPLTRTQDAASTAQTPPAAEPAILRVGRCELRPQSRELLLDGSPQAVRPLVFDLLMALVQQRPRAMSRNELMTAVWGRTVVTDSALTRTVMEARRAIGDCASAPTLIATVHSFGYRFDGHVEVPPPGAPSQPWPQLQGQPQGQPRGHGPLQGLARPGHDAATPLAPTPAAASGATGRLRVGLMPCRNNTADASLDWARLGLMALVEHALGDAAVAWLPATTMAAALARLDADVLVEDSAADAMAALHLDRVVVPVLRLQQQALWVDFQVFASGHRAPVGHGSVRDSEPVALARRLAQALAGQLLPQRQGELRFFSGDAFVNQAYARAVELASHNDYSAARPLLDTVCQLEPDNRTGGLARLHVAVRMRDTQAPAMGAALLDACTAAGDTAMQARVHALLWEAVLNAAAPDTALAERHCQAAGTLATALHEQAEDWFLAFLSQQGVRAMQAGRAADARRLMDAAADACKRSGNAFRLAVLAQNRIGMDLQAGDMLLARQRLDEAAAHHRQLRQQPVGQLHVLTMSAYVNAGLGMLDAAGAQFTQMLSQLGRLQHPGPLCAYPFWAAQVCLDTGDVRGLATALQAFAALGGVDAAAGAVDAAPAGAAGGPEAACTEVSVQFGRWATEGCLRMCQGDVAAAAALLGRAMGVAQAAGGMAFLHECAKLQLRLESAVGDPQRLRALCSRVHTLPGLADCLPLQWALAHAEAACLLLQGDRAGALCQLSELIANSATGRENACARLDAAWLCCEQGDLARANRLLAAAGRWRHEHPAGMATEARLLMAAGRFEPAARLLRAAIERHQGLAPHWHHELLRCCEQAHAGHGREQWRLLPRLASASWQRGIVAAPTRRLQPRVPLLEAGDRRRLPQPALLQVAALGAVGASGPMPPVAPIPPFRSFAPLPP